MTKLAHVERERAIGMLKAKVTPLVVAKRFRCHVRTIERLKNRLQRIGTTSHRPRLGRQPNVKVETSRRLICAIDFVWSQSQLGHPKELIIKKNLGSNCEKSFQDICLRPHLPTFDGTLLWCSIYVKLRNPR